MFLYTLVVKRHLKVKNNLIMGWKISKFVDDTCILLTVLTMELKGYENE